jgi:hypothetical protein
MSITFKSVGHIFATFFKSAGSELVKLEGTKTIVEGTTGAILGAVAPTEAPIALSVESAAYAVLGEVASLISAGGAAAEAKLADAGLDQSVIAAAKSALAGASQVVTLTTAAVKSVK